jgi:hypothetical protein
LRGSNKRSRPTVSIDAQGHEETNSGLGEFFAWQDGVEKRPTANELLRQVTVGPLWFGLPTP